MSSEDAEGVYCEGRKRVYGICMNKRYKGNGAAIVRIRTGVTMDNWDEIRTAFQVARIGTVSGAADVLGVHHATVIRHIDALEQRLGVKLFQRHARGYTATEAGQDLMQVAAATDDQFTQLAGRIRGQGEGVSGDLVVTSLIMLSPILTPVLAKFRRENPDLTVRFLTGDRLFRLEYGEAHVAIRAGEAPNQPDNVVQPFVSQTMHLVAAPSYIAEYGLPDGESDLVNHWFIGHDSAESRAPFNRWLTEKVPQNRIVFRTTDHRAMFDAVLEGAGIGFVATWELKRHPELVEVIPSEEEWSGPLWLVTHVDLHRTTKVQAFLTFLKKEAEGWEL
jgi:DNA-binding transcriptional LysR family regulator